MNLNAKYPEQVAILATLDPVSQAAATVQTGWVSAAAFHNFCAVVQTGVLGASATVDAKIQQATSSGGAGAKDVTGKALVQIVKASGDNKQATIDFRADDLDQLNGYSFVRLQLTVGTAASLIAAQLLGFNPRNAPASVSDQAAVVQHV